ncbi:MAG: hypothetical protein GY754_07955 [bacterium]|nr:hypothetical protein [bacterium]
MGVDLSLWVLNKEEKYFIIFPLQRRRAAWSEIRELPTEMLPDDFYLYKAYEYNDKSNIGIKKGFGKYSGKRKREPDIQLIEDSLRNDQRSRMTKEERMLDCYGTILRSTKAIYLQVMAFEEEYLLFEDYCSSYAKELFLNIPDDSDVLLYWC